MRRSATNPWIGIGLDAWQLGVESYSVIGLRTLRLAQGGEAARAEAERMVTEKVEAGIALQTLAMAGGLGLTPASASARAMAHYRRKVRANRRRLTRG